MLALQRMETKTTFKENLLRVVAIVGLLAILLLGAWGIIQMAFFISSLFSNAGGAVSTAVQTQVQESLTLSVPQTATPGTATTINWKLNNGTANYSYSVSYSCASGLSFKAPLPTGATQAVNCNTPFNYTQATQFMTLTPVYAGTTDAQTTITVSATNLSTGAIVATVTGNMTVLAKKAAAKPATTYRAPATTYVAANRTAALYGYPDLAVTITSAYSQNGNATIQFVIQNIGTNVSPANWSFVSTLPINGSYQYPSGPQRALYPGDKIAFTLNFSDYDQSGAYGYNNYPYNQGYTYGTCNAYGPCAVPGYSGGCGYAPCGYAATVAPYGQYNYGTYGNPGYGQNKVVSIQVDPYNQIPEVNKNNNYASASYVSY
jgi:hypothetical protein